MERVEMLIEHDFVPAGRICLKGDFDIIQNKIKSIVEEIVGEKLEWDGYEKLWIARYSALKNENGENIGQIKAKMWGLDEDTEEYKKLKEIYEDLKSEQIYRVLKDSARIYEEIKKRVPEVKLVIVNMI